MRVSRVASLPWPFGRYFRVAWYSQWRHSFVVGNAANRRAYPVDRPSDPLVIVQRDRRHVMRYKMYDPLLPERDYEELAARGMDGFKFLSREQYDKASPDSPRGSLCPMDVALASGLSVGKHRLQVQHPVGGAILRMEDKRICLMHLSKQGLEEASAVRVGAGTCMRSRSRLIQRNRSCTTVRTTATWSPCLYQAMDLDARASWCNSSVWSARFASTPWGTGST
jgi:hypothetical protein